MPHRDDLGVAQPGPKGQIPRSSKGSGTKTTSCFSQILHPGSLDPLGLLPAGASLAEKESVDLLSENLGAILGYLLLHVNSLGAFQGNVTWGFLSPVPTRELWRRDRSVTETGGTVMEGQVSSEA